MTREQSREVSVERKFTEDELQDMAEEMTTLVLDKERHEDEKSAYNKEKNEIIKDLDLRRPIYRATASFGHFGRTEPGFTWERTDKAASLRSGASLK